MEIITKHVHKKYDYKQAYMSHVLEQL